MKIGVIGYGSFTKFLEAAINQYFPNAEILIYSRSNEIDNKKFFTLPEVCSTDILIPSVPIHAFENTIKEISPLLSENTLVFEVCSVKVHPKDVLEKYLPKNISYILSHPMFGPESFKKHNNSIEGFNLVIEKGRIEKDKYADLLSKLRTTGLNIIEMSAEEHDRKAAVFQFTTIFMGLVIRGSGLERTEIDTASARQMHNFTEMIGDDIGILKDMYKYNPYCKEQLNKIFNSTNKIVEKVLA
jgi:prephenate dehydrogenase